MRKQFKELSAIELYFLYLDPLAQEFTRIYPFERSVVNEYLCKIKRVTLDEGIC